MGATQTRQDYQGAVGLGKIEKGQMVNASCD